LIFAFIFIYFEELFPVGKLTTLHCCAGCNWRNQSTYAIPAKSSDSMRKCKQNTHMESQWHQLEIILTPLVALFWLTVLETNYEIKEGQWRHHDTRTAERPLKMTSYLSERDSLARLNLNCIWKNVIGREGSQYVSDYTKMEQTYREA